ncbi:MAG: apolipoprotein N-acyltransferase [Planctomycetaceae bacterium]|jgi:apolipoprotein N-acyltransferase|nr:apolipoprotein N-acyltransferase [Planctomycetaceae bacterium]
MSLYLFFLGTIIFCVLQFAYGSQFCLAVFLVPLLWVPLLTDKSVLKYRYVYFASFIFWLVSIQWISAPHPVAVLGLLILAGYLSFYWLLFFVSARTAIHNLQFPVMAAMPLCWIGCEFLRNNLLGGFSFCSIEHLLFATPILIQIADIGGGYLVGGMIMSVGAGIGTILFASVLSKYCHDNILTNNAVAINVTKNTQTDNRKNSSDDLKLFTHESTVTHKNLLAEQSSQIFLFYRILNYIRYMFSQKYNRAFFVTIICTFLIIAATLGYGYLTIFAKLNPLQNNSTVNSRKSLTLKIAALQGNSPVSITMTDKQLHDCLQQYIDLTQTAVRNNHDADLDLIIWAETVCPIPYVIFQNGATYKNIDWNQQYLERAHSMLLNISAEVGVPILYGISTIVVDNNRNKKSATEPLRLNSALLVVPKPPEFKSRYDKIQLVMFGEYVPFADYLPADFPLRSICQEAGRGDKPVAMLVGKNIYASVNICFESTIPHHVRRQILSLKKLGQEPALLINISNSGWFGFANQIDQHLATHVFRAAENRRQYVSATNCGFSVTINCYGQITKIGKRKSAEPVIDQLEIQYWTPIYHYIGDMPAIICTIFVIFLALCAYRKILKK